MTLNYTDGSPCDSSYSSYYEQRSKSHGKDKDDDDDDDDDDDEDRREHSRPSKAPVRRKSTLVSFICDRDSLAPKAHVSFIGASPDECTYFFEARSMAACGGVIAAQQSLSPGGVFGVIALIAAAVYLLGGIAYQRTVMHQRGWRQLPNYSLWAGIFGFLEVSAFWADDPIEGEWSPLTQGYRTSLSSSRAPAPESCREEKVTISCPQEAGDEGTMKPTG